MSTATSASAQPTSASQSDGGANLSNVLGSIGQTSTDSASATDSSSESASASSSASRSATATSASGSNTITNAPSLSTASSAPVTSLAGAPSLSGIPTLTNAPTLSGGYSYPPPSVPPTANAPYMHRTNLPENFVFIIVGACIAFVALVIIAWRILTSWSINRRFGRHEGIGETNFGKPSYTLLTDMKQKPHAPSHDTKDLGNLPRNFSSVPSLFFSPTAEVARHSTRPPSSRDTHGHLPAGHYRDGSRY